MTSRAYRVLPSRLAEWQFPRVAKLVRGLGRGHRINHGPTVRAELLELKRHL